MFDGPHAGYRDWLDQDVRWIITDDERRTFKKLQNDEERDTFVEQFWLRRDPTPTTIENEFKDEHYRRMMYANEHFGTTVAGWRTDRGRIYVMKGPPDAIKQGMEKVTDDHGREVEHPLETWHYNSDGLDMNFVDTCRCNEYQMTLDRKAKDKLLDLQGDFPLPLQTFPPSPSRKPGIQVIVEAQNTAQPKFKDLEEDLAHKINVNPISFTVTTASFRITDWTDWVVVTIHYRSKDLRWMKDGNAQRAQLHLFGRFITLTQHVAQVFEDEVNLEEPASARADKTYSYREAFPRRAGLYRLDVALQDVNADRVGTRSYGISVPSYDETSHISSIVLSKNSGEPIFHAVDEQTTFAPSDSIHLFAQVYGIKFEDKTRRSNVAVDYEVFSMKGKKPVSVLHVSHIDADPDQREQSTLQKELPSGPWKRGEYDLVIKARDNVGHQDFCAEQPFTVN